MRMQQVKNRFKAIEDRLDALEGKKPKEVEVKEEIKEVKDKMGARSTVDGKDLRYNETKKEWQEEKHDEGWDGKALKSRIITKEMKSVEAEEPVEEKPQRVVTKTSDIKGKELKEDK